VCIFLLATLGCQKENTHKQKQTNKQTKAIKQNRTINVTKTEGANQEWTI
jgi:hypothetical protein